MQTNLNNKNKAIFSIKRKPIVGIYDNLVKTRNYLGLTSRSGGDVNDLSTFYNGSYLDPYFKQIGNNNTNCIKLSNSLYSTNRIYQNVLDYLSTMYFFRYVVVPRKVKHKDIQNKLIVEDYRKIYDQMVEIVEGLKIESIFPKLLLNIFKNGQIYLYATGDKKSQTLSTIILPNEKCRSTIMTQHGTTQIEFNFRFFEEVTTDATKREMLFGIFPKEFKELYTLYKTDPLYKDGWVPLDPKRSTSIAINEQGFPTFLSVFYDIIDYKNYKLNEMDRNTNGLEKLVVQEIDMQKTEMDMTEITELHESMSESISQNGCFLVTTPGNIKVEQLQEERSQENKVLDNAYKTIYDNAGFNHELFSGGSAESLTSSLKRDLAFVWQYVEQLTNFYNLVINNIFNFHDYQASIRILPISPYNEKEKMEIYHQNATIGIGILDSVVATGIKQVDLESTIELEQFLDLRNRLTPLQSSHTQSSSTTEESSDKVDKKETAEPQKVTEDSKNTKENEDKNNPDDEKESSVVEEEEKE